MHRDFKPERLGLMSLTGPKGVILDSDSATVEKALRFRVGTRIYQPPEMKKWLELDGKDAEPPDYEKGVDIWVDEATPHHEERSCIGISCLKISVRCHSTIQRRNFGLGFGNGRTNF